MEITYRDAAGKDIEEMKRLILEHGPNQYNYLPPEEVKAHIDAIKTGKTKAVVALDGKKIVGFASYVWGKIYPQYCKRDHGYLAEAVVHGEYGGKGIGSELLGRAVEGLGKMGYKEVFAKRHEENDASRRMMEKNGFKEVDTFPDPIRTFGSKRTTVMMKSSE